MATADNNDSPKMASDLAPTRTEPVMQVERHDYPDLAPQGGKRTQAMRGFDAIYTDIVDYIVRCTHRIWDERDIGLIYSHYTHNCVLYGTTGTIYTREEVVRDTIQRLVSFPERRGMATQVIWSGDEDQGFYTSHLVTDTERHALRWLHDVYNRKMLGTIAQVYAPTVQYHGPLMAELYGVASVIHQSLGLIGSLPDAAFTAQHICSTPCAAPVNPDDRI